jgi:hypothetical protein
LQWAIDFENVLHVRKRSRTPNGQQMPESRIAKIR